MYKYYIIQTKKSILLKSGCYCDNLPQMHVTQLILFIYFSSRGYNSEKILQDFKHTLYSAYILLSSPYFLLISLSVPLVSREVKTCLIIAVVCGNLQDIFLFNIIPHLVL